MNRALYSFALTLAALTSLSFAQEQQSTLVLQQPVKAELAAEEIDSYVLELGASQFVAGAADQLSVDVVVTIFNPDKTLLARFDGPGVGPEFFSFETKEAGAYRIDVAPFEQATGSYSITLEKLEPIAESGPARANQLMAAFSGASTPGGVVAVVQEGELLFEAAYGIANLQHDVPFTVETLSNLGSTSKQFTAFAICLLESEGLLSLDDDVRDYIPELPEFDEVVTVRNLLTHTSGYREFLNTLAMAGRRLDQGDYIDREEVIRVVQKQPKLQNSPGSEWNYNNTGFGLLTVIVERLTDEAFPDWMRENVFLPLGMKHTVVRSNPSQVIRGSAQGYVAGPDGFSDSRDLGASMGAGGIYSTVGDLAKWMRNLQTGELGGAEVLSAMTTPYELTAGSNKGKSTGYGFGLFIDKQNGLRRYQHGGADSAHRAMLMVYPDIDAGVVVLSNNASFDATTIANKIAEAFFADAMTMDDVPEIVPAKATSKGEKEQEFDPASFDPETFDAYVGRYELDEAPGFVLRFFRKDGRYLTQATGQQELDLIPTSNFTFKIKGVDAKVEFHRAEDGGFPTLTLHQNGAHKAKRLKEEPWAPKADELASYEGRYFSAELESFYTIAVEGEALVLKHRRLDDAKLTPAEKHVFTGPSMAKLTFALSESGEVTGFVVSAGRTRGVEFVRME